ncbi:MAG: hypothetical protein ACYC91_05055 [Solirubrobacteraceae bacterium]
MQTFTMPYSGRLLVTHLASYGLAVALDARGVEAFVGHDPDAVELTPQVFADVDLDEVAACIRASALECKSAVEADLEPGRTGNGRIPVIRARATEPERAAISLAARERLLDDLEAQDARSAAALIAGLGAPGVWLRDAKARDKRVPAHGASRLDGVPYNIGSDIVRGALRHSLPAATAIVEEDLRPLTDGGRVRTADETDRLLWSPPGTRIALVYQWLAALGLELLPVGLSASARARTPGFWQESGERGIALPVISRPVSAARLRSLLQLPDLVARGATPAAAKRLRALGICELVTFMVLDSSSGTMVKFSFGPARRFGL